MIEEKEVQEDKKEMTYLESIDTRDKNLNSLRRPNDYPQKLEALASFNYYGLFV